jgi:hypothetical protein
LRNHSGGVALLVINTSRTRKHSIDLPTPTERYTLTAQGLEGKEVRLNGRELKSQDNDELPRLEGARIPAGNIELAPTSITFLAIADANDRYSH